jgi:hypothetical protein
MDNITFFKEAVKHYFFEVFKLYQYNLEIEGVEEEGNYLAATIYDTFEDGSKAVTISYSIPWLEDETSKEKIELVAFHEVLEALLADLVQVAESRYIMESMVPNAIHTIIRTFENTVFKYLPKLEEKNK